MISIDELATMLRGLPGGFFTALLALFGVVVGHSLKSRTERERVEEQVSLKLLEARIEPYVALQQQLATVSNLNLDLLDEPGRRAMALKAANAFHAAIYGKVGVLASTVTRETILCARQRCKAYAGST